MTDNTQSDVVAVLRRGFELGYCAGAYRPSGAGPPTGYDIKAAMGESKGFNAALASLSTRDSDGLVGELRGKLREFRSGGMNVEGLGWWLDESGERILTALTSSDAVLEGEGSPAFNDYERRLRYAVEAPTGREFHQRLNHLTRHDVRKIISAIRKGDNA